MTSHITPYSTQHIITSHKTEGTEETAHYHFKATGGCRGNGITQRRRRNGGYYFPFLVQVVSVAPFLCVIPLPPSPPLSSSVSSVPRYVRLLRCRSLRSLRWLSFEGLGARRPGQPHEVLLRIR